jgi:hypothetical protein
MGSSQSWAKIETLSAKKKKPEQKGVEAWLMWESTCLSDMKP